MRLIDADALMQTLGITDMDCVKCAWYSKAYRRCKRGGDFEDACCAIEDAPTIEAVPDRKKGRWIHDGYDFFPNGIDWIHCSKSGKRWINIPADLPKYCPCCGARMEGAEDAGRDK